MTAPLRPAARPMPTHDDQPDPVIVTASVLRDWPLPDPGQDKESRGRILIIGGSRETPGAVYLAAEAALRAGAGKLQVATVASIAPHLAVALPEGLVRPLPETPSGTLGAEAVEAVADLVEKASAVLVGPGLSGVDDASAFTRSLLTLVECTCVLDALALAALGDDGEILRPLAGSAVLTPNPSELALLLGLDDEEVAHDPLAWAALLARRTGVAVSLGGSDSYVVAPDGRAWLDQSGGRGLGVSGSGDVLAGVVAGLLARGAAPEQAAVWGAHLHGRAGDRRASAVGRLGFLARELPGEIPHVLAEIEV